MLMLAFMGIILLATATTVWHLKRDYYAASYWIATFGILLIFVGIGAN